MIDREQAWNDLVTKPHECEQLKAKIIQLKEELVKIRRYQERNMSKSSQECIMEIEKIAQKASEE